MANEKKEKIQEQTYHIYDFLVRCKINRVVHDSFMKKFGASELKTLNQWSDLTNLSIS
jgi:hypothetical protein